MTVELIEHDPAPSNQVASLEALENLVARVRAGEIRGYMIAMIGADDTGQSVGCIKESVHHLTAYDTLALDGALSVAKAYLYNSLTARED